MISLINAWSGYRSYYKIPKYPLKKFYESAIEQICGMPMNRIPNKNRISHLPQPLSTRRTCYFCKEGGAKFQCLDSGKAFHLTTQKQCFTKFHVLLNHYPNLTSDMNFAELDKHLNKSVSNKKRDRIADSSSLSNKKSKI